EFFIDHLRHPYARRPMLASTMIDPQTTKQGCSSSRDGSRDVPSSNFHSALQQAKGDDMSALVFTNHEAKMEGEVVAPSRNWLAYAQLLGATFGLAGGILAGLLGSLLTAVCWFVKDIGAHHALSIMGTTLLFMTIPLIIFGAYCMDWMEKDRP